MKIPTYQAESNPNTGAVYREIPVGPAMAEGQAQLNFVAALTAVGNTVTQDNARAKAALEKKQHEEAVVWSDGMASAIRMDATKFQEEATLTMPPGGEGHANRVDSYYTTKVKQAEEGAPSAQAAQMLRLRTNEQRASFYGSSLQQEATEKIRYKSGLISDGTKTDALHIYAKGAFGLGVYMDPGQMLKNPVDYGKALGPKSEMYGLYSSKRNAIAESGLPTQVKQNLVATLDKEFTESYLYNRLNNDPHNLIQELKSNFSQAFLEGQGIKPDQNTLQSFLSAAQAADKARMHQFKGQVSRWMDDNIASIQWKGAEIEAPLSQESTMMEAVGEDNWAEYLNKRTIAWGVRKGLNAILENPHPTNMMKVLEDHRRAGVGDATAEQRQIYEQLAAAASSFQKMVVTDGATVAAEAMKNADIKVHDNYGQMHTNDSYARASAAMQYQKMAGLPEYGQQPIPVDDAKRHVNAIMQLPTNVRLQYLEQLENEFLDHYPAVQAELIRNGLPEGILVTKFAAGTASGPIWAEAAGRPTKELEAATGLTPPDLTALERSVQQEMRPWIQAHLYGDSTGRNANLAKTLYQQAYNTVLGKVMNGTSPSQAVKEVVNDVVHSQYYIQDTYWIPKKIQEKTAEGGVISTTVNDTVVKSNLEYRKLSLDKFDPVVTNVFNSSLPGSSKREALVFQAQKNGYWLVNELGDGVYLGMTVGINKGVPIINAAGQRYEFKFADLNRTGPTASGKITRPDSSNTIHGEELNPGDTLPTGKGTPARGELLPIDRKKPIIVNDDGSVSTERTITIESDGKWYVVPTIVKGKDVGEREAEALFMEGQNKPVGEFETQKEADAYAAKRSQRIGEMIKGRKLLPKGYRGGN